MSGGNDSPSFRAVGENVRLYPSTVFIRPENITIGNNVTIDDFVFLNGGFETVFGNNIHVSTFTSVVGGGRLHMGSFATIGAGCRIVTGSEDFTGNSLANPTVPKEFKGVEVGVVTIGAHVLLGSNCVVLPNSRIGEGAVVSAGSVVDGDLESWSVYVGHNPRRIKKRDKIKILELEMKYHEKYGKFNNEQTINRIQEIKSILESV